MDKVAQLVGLYIFIFHKMYIYIVSFTGTTNKKKIELLKLGITAGLLKVLEEDDQIKNIEKDPYGNIQGNVKLKEYYMGADDYTKFEIGKYIKIT